MLTFFIDKENKLIIEKYTSITRIANVAMLMVKIWDHPDYDRNYNRIADFREVDLVFSREEFQSFIKVVSENTNSMRSRAAILVEGASVAAIATIYADRMNHLQKIGIFASESEVMNFLNIDDSIFSKIQSSDAVRVGLEA